MTGMQAFWRIVGAVASTILGLFLLVKVFDVHKPMLSLVLTILIFLSFFAAQIGGAGPKLRLVFALTFVVMLLVSWNFTGPTAKSAIHKVQEIAPRETYDPETDPDPKNPEVGVQAKFYERPDGTIEKVPYEWKRNPITGERLALAGSPEHLDLRDRWEVQQAKKESASSTPPPGSVRVKLQPGQSQTVFPRDLAGTNCDYTWGRVGGKAHLKVYNQGSQLVFECDLGPSATRCNPPYTDNPRLVFTAAEQVDFPFTCTPSS